jgi:isopentenyl-diphosphate delta-isomerase
MVPKTTHKNAGRADNSKDMLVLVDTKDRVIGKLGKAKCHEGEGKLHRAFSAYILNSKGQLLIHQRAKAKKLWPLFWTNSCCSHPREGESYVQSAERRIKEELGIRVKPKYIYKFIYHAPYKGVGSEWELCAVLVGRSDQKPQIDSEEIADWRYADIKEIAKDMEKNPGRYTPWFRMQLAHLLEKHRKELGMK